jgi:error-prone DNA polymerase
MRYVELHSRSVFSFLRGASLPEQLAEVAAHLNMPAMALCDRDGVYGAPRFFKAAKEVGIRPIVGAELTMEDGSILPVLVKNRTGYQNLCRLLTRAHLRSEKGKSKVDWEELPEFAEGLVALTGDEEGPIANQKSKIKNDQSLLTSAATVLENLLRIFGRDHLFVEIQRHHVRGENRINEQLVELATTFKLPLLATNGVLHATPAGRQVLDVFTCIRNHTHLDAAGKLLSQNSERFLKHEKQMRALFRDLPDAIENTSRLADRLQFSLENLGYEFPKYPIAPGETMDGVLREKAFDGARKRYDNVPEKVRGQLENELALISKLGVAGYFLIVWDIVEFCREQNIMAQGRGSAANSSVCFCLGITNVDPLKFHTLFERFLSEGRKNCWPDIDIDLPSGDRRERVIQEVYKRYGKHGAAMTANVITYRGRSAAREIGKALNISTDVIDRFSNLFANGDFPHTLDFNSQIEQAGLPSLHPRARAFAALYLQFAKQHLPRHLGQHSGGMIVCQDQLSSVVPLENASMPGRVVAQWDKDDCEDLGIIKIDFLGLGMMSVIQDSIELTRQLGRPVDPANLPQDDPKTFEMIRAADTIGVFQIESRAQMATLPRMKPKNFYDLCIEVAIIRPGPIQGNLTNPYLKRRDEVERGAAPETMPCYHENLRPVLGRTLGVPLFQEQMLEMAMVMTDFTASEAEELRRALSYHRSQERMEKVEKKLRDALQQKGYEQKVIDEVANAVTSFALYGFPESHAISFAHLAYATAYLKAHRAPEFYASLLNNQPMGFYSSSTLIKDGKRHGVQFRPVSVEKSGWLCTIEKDDSVRLGFCVVRGLNQLRAEEMLRQRAAIAFSTMEDFKRRTSFQKEELRTLAEIGALNDLSKHRREALWKVERTLREDDLFEFGTRNSKPGITASESSPLLPMTLPERLRADYTGMQLTTGPHPMALLREKCNVLNVWRAGDLPKAKNGQIVCIAGNVICRQRPGTAKGFVFITLEDETGMSNAVVAPKLFEKLRLLITSESFLMITGKLQNVENVIHIQARKIERLPHEKLVGSASYDFH